jgi:hypothetical protein
VHEIDSGNGILDAIAEKKAKQYSSREEPGLRESEAGDNFSSSWYNALQKQGKSTTVLHF